jgi:SAM-dependent methyltransferase
VRKPWRRADRNRSQPEADAAPYLSHVDSPRRQDPPTHSVLVRGWVAVPRTSKWEGPFVDVGELRQLELVQRGEVEAGFGDEWQVTGYQSIVPITPATAGGPWELVVRVEGREYREPLDVYPSAGALDEFQAIKRRKLERIERILRCPRPLNGRIGADDCRGELKRVDAGTLECTRCGARYTQGDESYDFLPTDLAAASGIAHTDNISSWGHDPIAARVIANQSDGLVLDAGSGFKSTLYEHVVNLEVVDYPSTDVLGVGEHLPFATGSFDAALSLNVLEHVRDPFRCARELARVVRPEGKLYVSAPFLQPYHGYPHHYYNMTASGLENLFADAFTVEELRAPASAVPIWALSWFLNSYVAGLPADVAERFRKMSVEQLMAPAVGYLDEDFVTGLRASTNIELACGIILLGTRKPK